MIGAGINSVALLVGEDVASRNYVRPVRRVVFAVCNVRTWPAKKRHPPPNALGKNNASIFIT